MRKAWLIFRAIAVVALLIGIIVPISLYIALSTPWAQDKLRSVAESELSTLLDTEVEIGRVIIHPLNRVSISDVSAKDDFGKKAVSIARLDAFFELRHFLLTGHPIIDYTFIDGADIHIYRQTPDSDINIAHIIDRLKSDNKEKPKSKLDFKINTIALINSSVSYDVLSEPNLGENRFDKNHIAISGLHVNAYVPHIRSDRYTVKLESLGFNEESGFTLSDLRCNADITNTSTTISGLTVKLPESQLSIEPLTVGYSDLNEIGSAIKTATFPLATTDDSHIYLPDLAAFFPALNDINRAFDIQLSAIANLDEVDVRKLSIRSREDDSTVLTLACYANNIGSLDDLQFDIKLLKLKCNGADIAGTASKLIPQKTAQILRRLNNVNLELSASGKLASAEAKAIVNSNIGSLLIDGTFTSADSLRNFGVSTTAKLRNLNVGLLTNNDKIGSVNGIIDGNAAFANRKLQSGEATLNLSDIIYNGRDYHDINLYAKTDSREVDANLTVNDFNISADLDANINFADEFKSIVVNGEISKIDIYALGLTNKYQGKNLSAFINIDLNASDIDDIDGNLTLSNVSWVDDNNEGIHLDNFDVQFSPYSSLPEITVSSDFLNGNISGEYAFSSLMASIKRIAHPIMPSLIDDYTANEKTKRLNNFDFDFTIANCEEIADFFKLPIQVIYPVTISGELKDDTNEFSAAIDAPYLQQGDKIIDNTTAYIYANADLSQCKVYATTHMPTNKGPMTLIVDMNGATDRLDTYLNWHIDRKIPLNGSFSASTLFSRNDNNAICAKVDFNPGEINFGNEVWRIANSTIDYTPEAITIDDFAMESDTQQIHIDGVVAEGTDDLLEVNLKNVDLITIFETLEINKALIGGRATGTIYAGQLYSKQPQIRCENLHVKDIGYNYCTIGDANIQADWDNDRQAFHLDADIVEPGGQKSRIYGYIFPSTEALDINFDANHVKIGFMRPFMEAFASDVDGYASGHARLFGTFKYIDMEGDILAEDLKIKIDFTNTYYSATDSIHMRPGLIDVPAVTIYDINGNTAKLTGKVWHKFFKQPSFDFRVTQARNFLSYNISAKQNPDWYGTIYGNGSASITGEPGVVNIGVNMSTAPNSTFTFVLSDMEEVDDYAFITFRDKTPVIVNPNDLIDDIPAVVKEFQTRRHTESDDAPSAYNMDLQVDITPQAQMILVMDPIGGDRIKANGSGNLRMTYGSVDNDLRMYGTYTLDQGSYNFTLQDIIIKDFTIKSGSNIAFHGDPYSAQLDIDAVYAVNANLSDLDESFLQDKDLNRTNVPVHALMQVSGDMRQPDISFDLEFPTLTSDTYRKVKSIVSTEEMMNQQIIYLLALNRFYTPNYMGNTTKGNELFSVASSTLASQLSNMLGKLSDNWSIAPNLRSDRGDFSDVEVDLALSSRLLNNRLLFNGNFGYRDKSLNTNQFVGDFDIEYLLNNRGTWRLKAYNRYNDQNYYLRTAATTQGVGIMFKRDFDGDLSWLKWFSKPSSTDSTSTVAPIESAPADSITVGKE
jgi:hypothetical protein